MSALAGWIFIFLILVGGCVAGTGTGKPRTESQTVPRQGAESVTANITMGVGRLRIAGGAEQLLDAQFTYTIPKWRPIVQYDVSGTKGNLVVRQPTAERIVPDTNVRYEWDLRLNNDVPMDLKVDLGAGQSNIDLRGLNLGKLDLNTGAGHVIVDLTGDWQRDVTTTINAGVGNLTVRLPKGVGVRVDIDRGIGTVNAEGLRRDSDAYVNDAFGQTAVTMRVLVSAGVGAITLQVGA
jgi:hypothetical protein